MKKFIDSTDKMLILQRMEESAIQNSLNEDDGYQLEMFMLRYMLIHSDDQPAIAEMFHAFKAEFWEGNDG